jgi:antitoxin (DNA-binding transcriptional repressor) of toxin-antitoxin stability system
MLAYMKSVKISELKNNLSRFLAYVRRGGTVRVFDREMPIADLTPCAARATDAADDGDETLLQALERDGIVQRGTGKLPADFLQRKLPKAKASVLRALLDERKDGR